MRLEPSLDGSRPTTLHATIWEMIWNCYEAGWSVEVAEPKNPFLAEIHLETETNGIDFDKRATGRDA